jgi:hypothetical protein
MVSKRDRALGQARLFRNQVDELRSKSRQMCAKLNDRVNIVRNFWRNNIAEGSTQSGRCVRQADINTDYLTIIQLYINDYTVTVHADFFLFVLGHTVNVLK